MDDSLEKKLKNDNILNRIQKKFSVYEGFLIMKKEYFTNNILYYFLCVLFRFIHLILFCGDYFNIINKNDISFKHYIRILTCYNIIQQFHLSYTVYIIIILIIIILFIVRIIIIGIILNKLNNYKNSNKWLLINKLHIIIEHIVFLLYPYIIETLSFIYYIGFFPNKFFNDSNGNYGDNLHLIYIINTILIILYNIENYFNIICVNKIYKISFFDAFFNLVGKHTKNNNNLAYKCSNNIIYMYIILQNFVLFLNLENFLNIKYKVIFKIIVSIILLLIILILFVMKINEFNYSNIINTSINVMILFCFYTITIDFILFISRYRLSNILYEIFYIIIKLIISYITYFLFIMKTYSYLESKITEIVFEEKSDRKPKFFINCFYYMYQIMLKIKEQNTIDPVFFLIKFLNKHTNNCNKIECNCKLFQGFIKIRKSEIINNYISEILIILNYLYESAFIYYDFYNNYDLTILLANYYCDLKNNPIMAFSVISTLVIKFKNKLNKFQLVELYELNQKYINYISAKDFLDLELGVKNKQIEILLNNQRRNEFEKYYIILKISYEVKRLINNYIDNEIIILQYKYIFENSLTFQFEDNTEKIISAKITFFKEKAKNDNLYLNEYNKKHNRKNEEIIYDVIYLIKNEELYYQKIINSINKIKTKKNIPIFIIFKYFLFFDFFLGYKIPIEIEKKLYNFLTNKITLYNANIKNNVYIILKKRYKEHYNKINSKFYSLFEFKKDIRIKYLSEDTTLKLGYRQKDIFNEKMDILLPKVFYDSHYYAIKQLVIGNQIKFLTKQSFYFDKSGTILYPANFEISLIYNISKSFIIILESFFIFKKEYIFMLDNNFELIAASRNFEDEYYLNQRLLKIYNIRIIDIFKTKPEKFKKHFKKEYIKINEQKFIKQIKIEEYFIPQLYKQVGSKKNEIINEYYFKNSKRNIISKISKSIINENNIEEINNTIDENEDDVEDEEEMQNLIQTKNIKKVVSELFIIPREVIIHKTYSLIISKKSFIESLSKELTKIPDNDAILENDKIINYLIISVKKLMSELLTKNELAKDFLKAKIKLIFIYDKPYYFITIEDEKKLYLNVSKTIHFENNNKYFISNSSSKEIKKNIPYNKKSINSRNKILTQKNSNKNVKILLKNNQIDSKNKSNKNKDNIQEENNTILMIKTIGKKINKDKFITIIRWILSIIIIFILIIYIFIIIYQKFIINISEKILFTYYYNAHTRDVMLYIHSKLLYIYYDYLGLITNSNITEQEYQKIIIDLGYLFKYNHYDFWDYYFFYNDDIGNNSNIELIYRKRNYTKLGNYWEEINYEFDFSSEIDVVIYNIISNNLPNRDSKEIKTDLNNFLFFKFNAKKIYTRFIKLLYYFNTNYEFLYKDVFLQFETTIHQSYKDYIKTQITYYILLEIFGLLFYFIFFFSVNYYLYYSNEIIIKNIIFLFLDFTEENKNIKNNNKKIINLKLIELKKLMNDFDLNMYEEYSSNIDNINKEINININKEKNSENLNQYNKNKNSNKKSKKNSLKKSNNPLHNGLLESTINFSKDKINNNSINASKDILLNTKSSVNNYTNQNANNNSLKKNDNEETENIQEMILNGSNKTFVFIIKIYIFIILILILAINVFSIYKIQYSIKFNTKFNSFFTDFTAITNRYSILFYYYNTLRILLIFPEEERKIKFENIMETMDEYYDSQNKIFLNVLSSNIKTYKEIIKLFNKFMESKNNSIPIIKETICEEEHYCIDYLDTSENLFSVGVDFAYRTCIINIKNIFLNYKNLKSKTDINMINKTLINSEGSEFNNIGRSLGQGFFYVQEKIFECFDIDVTNFKGSYSKNMSLFNIITIIFSFLIFLFVIIIVFISIWRYTGPIKETAFRINCSFYYIKNYSFTNNRKYESTLSI